MPRHCHSLTTPTGRALQSPLSPVTKFWFTVMQARLTGGCYVLCPCPHYEGGWNIFKFHFKNGKWTLSYYAGESTSGSDMGKSIKWQPSTQEYGRDEENWNAFFYLCFLFWNKWLKKQRSQWWMWQTHSENALTPAGSWSKWMFHLKKADFHTEVKYSVAHWCARGRGTQLAPSQPDQVMWPSVQACRTIGDDIPPFWHFPPKKQNQSGQISISPNLPSLWIGKKPIESQDEMHVAIIKHR